MMKSIHNDEDKKFFFDYFSKRVEFLYQMDILERIEGLILICTYLDALAGCRYRELGNYRRFREFVILYSDNADEWQKISFPLLLLKLQEKPSVIHQRIVEFLRRDCGVETSNYLNLNYSTDCSSSALRERAINAGLITDFDSESIAEIVDECEYTKIFWKYYRNYAIHEATTCRDEALNITGTCHPFYVCRSKLFNSRLVDNGVAFGIPRQFMIKTLKKCLENYRIDAIEGDAPIHIGE